MKILLVSLDWFGGVQYYATKALEGLGCDVVPCYYNPKNAPTFSMAGRGKDYRQTVDQRPVRKALRKMIPAASVLRNFYAQKNLKERIVDENRKLIQRAREEKPDLLFLIRGEIYFPETIRAINQGLKIPVFAWWLDSPFLIEPQYPFLLESITLYDHVFIFDTYYEKYLREMGVDRISYLPNCVDETVFSRQELTAEEQSEYGSDLVYLGAGQPRRILITEHFLNYDIKIWGIGYTASFLNMRKEPFKNVVIERIISPREAAKIYNAGKVILNFHHAQCIRGSNQRVFEIAACEGFQLASRLDSIAEFFNVGEDFICYDTLADLQDKVDYYLQHGDERREIARRACRKVVENHTYRNRMQAVLETASGM